MKLLNKILIIMAITISSAASGQEKVETKKIKSGHRTIHTEIIINATPEQVWEVLVDTKSYANWAKFMTNIEGEIKNKGEITAFFLTNEKKNKVNSIKHAITVIEGKEFSWSDVFMMGMKDYHRFIVEPTNDGKTRFIQSDLVQGRGARLLGKSVINFEEKNYPIFNKSLKAEVEKRFPTN